MNSPENPQISVEDTPWGKRFRLGKLALYGTILEGGGGIAAIATGEPILLAITTTVFGWKLGNAAHDAHNHYVNGYPNSNPWHSLLNCKKLYHT